MTRNLANLFEAVAAAVPDRPAVACGERRVTFAELDRRADALAHHLVAAGIAPGEHVGLHLRNAVEFVEALLGCLKARAVPININFRYTAGELEYLYRDAQLAGLLVGQEFAPAAAEVAGSCPELRHVIVLDDGSGAAAPFWPPSLRATGYEQALAGHPAGAPRAAERGPDDRYVLYTGGTTGMPKGVVWRQEDFYFAALSGGNPYGDPHPDAEALAAAAAAAHPMTFLLTAPLMHGAAAYSLFTGLLGGSAMVLMPRFDAAETLRLVQAERATVVMVVGDATARPLADELAAHRADYDLDSWFVLGSGGAILSRSVRAEIIAILPNLFVNDGFGASESGVDGRLEVGQDGLMRLAPNPRVTVVDERHDPIAPGSQDIGFLARTGHVPLGYHNDPERTARTFPVIDGARWTILGDMARVEADGTIVVLGRGSGCINTGGEKVFAEEVEQALKSHPAVADALVAGVPDERFGQRVAAVVEPRPGTAPGVEELREHCRETLAGYKLPATVSLVEQVQRSPTGKADYRWAKRVLAGE